MGGLHFARRACGTSRHRYAIEIESNYGRFRLQSWNRKQAGIGEPKNVFAKDHHLRCQRLEARFKTIAERRKSPQIRLAYRYRSGTKSCDSRYGFCSRPQPALLAPTFDQWIGDMDVTATDKPASALWTAKLVRGDRHQICAKCADVARDPARALCSIDVKYAA